MRINRSNEQRVAPRCIDRILSRLNMDKPDYNTCLDLYRKS